MAGRCRWRLAVVICCAGVVSAPSWLFPFGPNASVAARHLAKADDGRMPLAGATHAEGTADGADAAPWAALTAMLLVSLAMAMASPAVAYNAMIDSKVMAGGASTTGKNSGSSKAITRGVDLTRADYSGKKVVGVSFQQSIVRESKWVNSDCSSSSFFDADLANADFTGANLNQVNFELARLTGATLDNAVATEMYVNGTTKMDVKSIEGADFTDTFFRQDQINYLCGIAKGTNPTTKVSTRDSLGCPE